MEDLIKQAKSLGISLYEEKENYVSFGYTVESLLKNLDKFPLDSKLDIDDGSISVYTKHLKNEEILKREINFRIEFLERENQREIKELQRLKAKYEGETQ